MLKHPDPDVMKYLNLLFKVGAMMLGAIGFFFAMGLWINRQFDLSGVPIFIGILIGLVTGFYGIYREIMKME